MPALASSIQGGARYRQAHAANALAGIVRLKRRGEA
jgi:hypothetical protein